MSRFGIPVTRRAGFKPAAAQPERNTQGGGLGTLRCNHVTDLSQMPINEGVSAGELERGGGEMVEMAIKKLQVSFSSGSHITSLLLGYQECLPLPLITV